MNSSVYWPCSSLCLCCCCIQVLDVGANIGLFSLHVAERYAGCTVFAFEPIPDICAVLAKNTAQYKNIHVIACGLGDHDALEVPFQFFSDCPGESTRHPSERAVTREALAACAAAASSTPPCSSDTAGSFPAAEVCGSAVPTHPATPPAPCLCTLARLSTVIHSMRMEHIELLKIDVEGDELNVLRGVDDADWPIIRQVAAEVCEHAPTECFACNHRRVHAAWSPERVPVWVRRSRT